MKNCVPSAHLAERVIVPARTKDDLRFFLLDPRGSGVERVSQQTTSGEPQSSLTLSGATVDAADVLGERAFDTAAVEWLRDRALLGLCALQAGVVEAALRITARYTSTREQFGKPLATFQAVGQRAADAYIDVEAVRWTMWQAAWRIAAGLPASEEIAIAKFWASEGAHRVVYAAQHLHGGIGPTSITRCTAITSGRADVVADPHVGASARAATAR
jgi:alkylation response protein AidB-like acyl-CoA dehydrogenase